MNDDSRASHLIHRCSGRQQMSLHSASAKTLPREVLTDVPSTSQSSTLTEETDEAERAVAQVKSSDTIL